MANKASEEPFTISTLGRPFHLGMLYDCRSDNIIQGITLWDQKTLERKAVTNHNNDDYEMIYSDNIDDKSFALDVSIELKLSFLGGLVDVSGSGKYIDNRKSSNHMERVTLRYKCVTKSERMIMEQLGKGRIDHPDVFDYGNATHVVTGITYGGNAFFVFDRKITSASCDKELGGNLHAIIKKIPGLAIDGKGKLDLTEDEKKEAREFTCRYFGDFRPSKNPSSFEEAVDIYRDMPKLVGRNGENAVPIKAYLYPLNKLDSKACKLVREISAQLVRLAGNHMEKLHEFDVKCNDLLNSQAVKCFRGIKTKVQEFQSHISTFKLGFQKEIGNILPSIRGGSKEEGELADVLKRKETSPFGNAVLTNWIEEVVIQVQILSQYISSLSQIDEFASKSGDLRSMIMSPKYTGVLCFSILMPKSNSHLANMAQYLENANFDSNVNFIREAKGIPLQLATNESTMMEKARAFRDFFTANRDIPDLGFIVADEPSDTPEFHAKIKYYDNGRLSEDDCILPFSPSNLSVVENESTHDSILVDWEKPNHCSFKINHINVFCEDITGINPNTVVQVDFNATSHRIPGLKPGCEYQISTQSVCKLGVSLKKKADVVVRTRPTSQPGKPQIWQVSNSEIGVKWSEPRHIGICCNEAKYVIKQQEEESEWHDVNNVSFGNLSASVSVKPNVTYRFKVYCNCEPFGRSLDSETSDAFRVEIKPEELLKSRLHKHSRKLQDINTLEIYQPMLNLISSDERNNIQKLEFGKRKYEIPEKTILIVGATGSGKTTLINGIINYVFGVHWTDNFRFKLIAEPESQNKANCQTNKVSSYTIHHQKGYKVPYTLTLIDTPGFGDVQGRDQKIVEQIQTFFTSGGLRGIDKLDAVCFVIASSLPRCTPTQKYIFNQILSLFGKDIADNIFLMLTFADGQRPQVISSIEASKFPFKQFFKVNNSALYACNKIVEDQMEISDNEDEDDNFLSLFWKMGEKSLNMFMHDLGMTESKSLFLTRDVLNERHQLEVTIAGIQTDIKTGLNKLYQLQKELDVLTSYQVGIEKNKNFEYTVTEEVFEKVSIPKGQYISNCLTCNRTCHEVCKIPDNEKKIQWDAMSNGYCTICPGKCYWELHKNVPYKFVYREKQVKKTVDHLRMRYESATQKKLSAEKLKQDLKDEFVAVQIKVLGLTETVRKSLQRLSEISLKPNPLTTFDYLDILIDSEKSEGNPGWQIRIHQLELVKTQAEYMKQISDQGHDPLADVKKKIEEEIKQNKKGIWYKVSEHIDNIFM